MTTVRTKIFRTHDPYANLPKLPLNLKGLSNNEPVLRSHIDALKPKVIVEVGTYLGASAVFMARHGLLYQPDIEVVCVDTFLGSVEHWMGADIVPNLGNGRLNLYFQFLNNVVEMNLVNYITPFPIDSVNGYHTLKRFGVVADLIYIDAGHEYESIAADLHCYKELVRVGGQLILDDAHYPPIQQAFKNVFPNQVVGREGNTLIWTRP